MLIGNTHLVRGDTSALVALCEALTREGVHTSGPDAYVRLYRSFGIDEARELRERAQARPVVSLCRVFVLAMSHITIEAQNALLKTLEEPPAGALFFFLLPSPDTLLPTLRSRAKKFTLNHPNSREMLTVEAEKFLSANPEKRLDMLKPLLLKDNEGEYNLSAAVTFLSSLERALSSSGISGALRPIYRARMYLHDKGALKKVLLEQVALLVSRV